MRSCHTLGTLGVIWKSNLGDFQDCCRVARDFSWNCTKKPIQIDYWKTNPPAPTLEVSGLNSCRDPPYHSRLLLHLSRESRRRYRRTSCHGCTAYWLHMNLICTSLLDADALHLPGREKVLHCVSYHTSALLLALGPEDPSSCTSRNRSRGRQTSY